MPERDPLEQSWVREKAAYYYIRAMDEGDLQSAAALSEAAVEDPELGKVLAEIDAAYAEEALGPSSSDAVLVRDLATQHLSSAFVVETAEISPAPLTVGEVAARLKVDRSPAADPRFTEPLLNSTVRVPHALSALAVAELAERLPVAASAHFWRAFRDTAIMLCMGRSHGHALLAATREQRRTSSHESRSLQANSNSQGPHSSTLNATWEQEGIERAVNQAFADAEIDPRTRASGQVPLDDLIRVYPLRIDELPALTCSEARRYLERATGQALVRPAGDDRALAGYLFAHEYAGFLYGCILVKQNDPVERRRFSAAHELGHYLLHFLPLLDQVHGQNPTRGPLLAEEGVFAGEPTDDELPLGQLTFRFLSDQGASPLQIDVDRMEREANEFAAAVLMPTAACRALMDRYRGTFGRRPDVLVRRMANDFLVSQSAMRRRLVSLELIEDRSESPKAGER